MQELFSITRTGSEDLGRALSHAENALRGYQAAGMPRDVADAQGLIGRLRAKLEQSGDDPKPPPP